MISLKKNSLKCFALKALTGGGSVQFLMYYESFVVEIKIPFVCKKEVL